MSTESIQSNRSVLVNLSNVRWHYFKFWRQTLETNENGSGTKREVEGDSKGGSKGDFEGDFEGGSEGDSHAEELEQFALLGRHERLGGRLGVVAAAASRRLGFAPLGRASRRRCRRVETEEKTSEPKQKPDGNGLKFSKKSAPLTVAVVDGGCGGIGLGGAGQGGGVRRFDGRHVRLDTCDGFVCLFVHSTTFRRPIKGHVHRSVGGFSFSKRMRLMGFNSDDRP